MVLAILVRSIFGRNSLGLQFGVLNWVSTFPEGARAGFCWFVFKILAGFALTIGTHYLRK